MKLLLDQNLSWRLVRVASGLFAGSAHVRDFGLTLASDEVVWRFARENGFAVASKDGDFRERAGLRGPPPKVIHLAVGNASTRDIGGLLRRRAAALRAFAEDAEAAVIELHSGERGL